MKQDDRISPRQLTAAVFVSLLSPLIRRFPRILAAHAGRAAYLAVPLSLLPLLPLTAAAALVFRARRPGTGLQDLFCDVLGPLPGRLLTGLYGLWFVFYAGFLLRSGAERFLTTIYTGAGPLPFVLGMALLCALAAAGRLLPLGRAAMLIRPLMCALFAFIALLTAKDLDLSLLRPAAGADAGGILAAALETVNLFSVALCFGFCGGLLHEKLTLRHVAPWLTALLGIVALMAVYAVGMFGASLTARMPYPYFMLVRDLSVLGALERAEPVVIALWVFPDFILISLLLLLAARNFRFCLGRPPQLSPKGAARALPLVCTAAAAAIALALPGDREAFRTLSERVVPLLSAAFGFGMLPPLLLIGALRKKL